MSLQEKHQKPNGKNEDIFHQRIAGMIAHALRADYGNQYSSIKQIAKHTEASLSTIKKWYEGQNPPNATNLILLARHSPSVMRAIIELIGECDEAHYPKQELSTRNISKNRTGTALPTEIYTEEFFGINVQVNFATGSKLNIRQLWFLGLLQHGYEVRAEHIAAAWKVTTRAGELDIAGMVKQGIIHFTGARKTGCYKIVYPTCDSGGAGIGLHIGLRR